MPENDTKPTGTADPGGTTWRDVLDTAKHYLGVLDSLLFLIGQSGSHAHTADGYVENKRIGDHMVAALTERLGQDTLIYARRVATEGWWDMYDALRKNMGPNDEVEGALWRTEKLLAVAASALRVKVFEDPDALPYDVTSGLCGLVHDELGRVTALYPALQEAGGSAMQRGTLEQEGADTDRDGSGNDGTPDEDADAGVPLPGDCTHSFICRECGLLEADRDTRHLLALMETATKEAERLHGRLPAEEAETFMRFVLNDLGDATAGFREIVDEWFDQPAGDLEALAASLR